MDAQISTDVLSSQHELPFLIVSILSQCGHRFQSHAVRAASARNDCVNALPRSMMFMDLATPLLLVHNCSMVTKSVPVKLPPNLTNTLWNRMQIPLAPHLSHIVLSLRSYRQRMPRASMQHYPLLQTKLYIPPIRPELVARPRLIEQLSAGMPRQGSNRGDTGFARKVTLISAPAGFGKTTLVSGWVQAMGEVDPPIAVSWLSLDEGDNDPARFLNYTIAALQTIEANIAKGMIGALQSPQPPPIEATLTSLINDVASIPDRILLVLDDYHVIAEGLTNQEIASRLVVSLNTITAHSRNIYGKLDVHSRTQAIARSREWGLLPNE